MAKIKKKKLQNLDSSGRKYVNALGHVINLGSDDVILIRCSGYRCARFVELERCVGSRLN